MIDDDPPVTTIDDFVVELRRLRVEADNPSYAELATRIGRAREAAGDAAGRARIARSTVYDVFRPGRRRLDLGLVREILQALGLDEADVTRWGAVAQRAVPSDDVAPVLVEPVEPVEPATEPVVVPVTEPVAAEPEVEAVVPSSPTPTRTRTRLALIIAGCVLGNLVGRVLSDQLDLPLHLDMVWTAVSAILLGPWWGALVGLTTNVVGVGLSGWASLWFTPVNVLGALLWGYGVRRFDLGRTLGRFMALNVAVAVACSLVATVVLLVFFDGTQGPQADRMSARLLDLTHLAVVGILLPNLVWSIADKVLSGFVALVVIDTTAPTTDLVALAAPARAVPG